MRRCCSSCLSSTRRQYYLENTKRINELRREHRLNKPELEIYNRIKSKAKRYNIPFDLTLEDIIMSKIFECWTCGDDVSPERRALGYKVCLFCGEEYAQQEVADW